ncbi:ABC transporter permease [Legionella beliardensis]|uniref:ABC transporter permease n=1 Tax=Legionella beliardensis TaxID=91822 RepID=A0A378I3Z4_9GAMM|nr:Fe-S cluster assembly protein SufD [Legionella beliardensis]STX29435.1 ABC transporter permease [Legionella beliardensis]
MSDILEFYQEQAKANRLPNAWLAELQGQALQEFSHYGFPIRKNEEWKYTALDTFLQQRFHSSLTADSNYSKEITQLTPFGWQLTLYNGQLLNLDEFSKKLPQGAIVLPLIDAVNRHPEKVKPYLAKLLKHEHGFHALNTAILQTGVFIYLPKQVCLSEPIVLAHWQDKVEQGIYPRHLIVAELGSQATLIELFNGQEEVNYLTNSITEIYLAEQAKLIHYKIQNESKGAFHIGHVAVKQTRASQFESHSIHVGGHLVRSDLSIYLEEERAQCVMNGLYLPKDKQHIDHHTTVYHQVPSCQSCQDYKGVLSGRARAVFNGKVIVAKHAQHTEARQQNKNLLLSAQAEVDTKPQLEIFANDVVCTHGATVGQLDEDALFYMATRGIPREQANRYLVHAFASENLKQIPHPEMREWIASLINEQLE